MRTFIVTGESSAYVREASFVSVPDGAPEPEVRGMKAKALAEYVRHNPHARRVLVFEVEGEPKTFEHQPAFAEVSRG